MRGKVSNIISHRPVKKHLVNYIYVHIYTYQRIFYPLKFSLIDLLVLIISKILKKINILINFIYFDRNLSKYYYILSYYGRK